MYSAGMDSSVIAHRQRSLSNYSSREEIVAWNVFSIRIVSTTLKARQRRKVSGLAFPLSLFLFLCPCFMSFTWKYLFRNWSNAKQDSSWSFASRSLATFQHQLPKRAKTVSRIPASAACRRTLQQTACSTGETDWLTGYTVYQAPEVAVLAALSFISPGDGPPPWGQAVKLSRCCARWRREAKWGRFARVNRPDGCTERVWHVDSASCVVALALTSL